MTPHQAREEAERSSLPWKNYANERPTSVGIYEWRLAVRSLPGAFVTFHAHMRERGSGYTRCISPHFDYWDGYQVIVPPETQWREPDPLIECKEHDCASLSIEGVDHAACLYCGKVPKLVGVSRVGGGVRVGCYPHELNTFWLDCCEWGKTPHLSDPREIERIRNAALLAAAKVKEGCVRTAEGAELRGEWDYADTSATATKLVFVPDDQPRAVTAHTPNPVGFPRS